MASLDLHEKANFTRLSKLLVDKGTEALRTTLDTIHPHANLRAVLNIKRSSLLKLKHRVINDSQWDLLFPPSGNPPDSKTFDITLVSILLRNICGLHAPASGWNAMPPDTDNSLQANITRIKLFRNQVYAHASVAQLDQTTFDHFWQKISQALLHFKIPQKEIDDLKTCSLGPEEEIYVQTLKEWKLNDDACKRMLADVQQQLIQSGVQQRDDRENLKSSVQHLTQLTEETRRDVQRLCSSNSTPSESQRQTFNFQQMQASQKLAKHNFKSKIRSKVKFFHPGTREWLLKEVDRWFTTEKESRLLLITAGPGVGKSVFAAKVCDVFKGKGELAACHFCDFSDTNLKNPMTMLQSLASHMCDNITGFKEKLDDQLNRQHKVHSFKDAFQIYLQNPLDELELGPSLIVIDALDESATDDKSEMVKLIADYFPELPESVKVLITSRPGLSLQRLKHIQTVVIDAKNTENDEDILQYLTSSLPCLSARDAVNPPSQFRHSNDSSRKVLPALVEKCEGSFLYAFHVQRELSLRENVDTMSLIKIMACLPEGMGSVYKEYFHRLEIELKQVMNKNADLFQLLEMFVAARRPLPLKFIARALILDCDRREVKKIIGKVNEAVSCLLYVSDDSVTVFHKSVYDWLLAQGYQDHEYAVKVKDGEKRLWLVCEQIFKEVKTNVVSGTDVRITNEVQHALQYGHSYLLSCNMEESFSWFVDMIISYVLSSVNFYIFYGLRNLLRIVLQSDVAISLPQQKQVSWHFLENSFEMFSHAFRMPLRDNVLYLQSVLEHSPEGCFTEDEKKIAETILKKHACILRRNSIVSKPVKSLLVKVFPNHIVAIGISSDKNLAAIALENGVICVLRLPDLAKLWQCSTLYDSISCCTFAPDDSFLLYGTLQTALDMAERKKVDFFDKRVEKFKSCAFSLNGKRLLTVDATKDLKVWDVVKQNLTAVLHAGSPVDCCSFSNEGLFITADTKNSSEDSYCVWNAITFQRIDQRRLSVSAAKNGLLKSEKCIRCFCPETKELISVTNLEIAKAVSMHLFGHVQLTLSFVDELGKEYSETSTGTYNGLECIFWFNEHSLRVIENIHFTTLVVWEIYFKPFQINEQYFKRPTLVDIIAIKDDLWLYSDEGTLVIFSTLPPKRHGSSQPCVTRILWCCFSPDSTRLATYTSDGFVNLFDVDDGQVYQRFPDNVETSSAACWWSSDNLLMVFHVIDKIPSLSKHPVDENFKTPGKPVQLHSVVEEFLQFSRIIDFSEGLLSFECGENEPVKLLDVTRIGNPEVVILLPENRPLMSIAVSAGASVVLGVDDMFIILWKRSDAQSAIYELFRCIPLSVFSQFEGSLLFEGCFSSDSKFAVASFVTCRSRFFAVIDVNTGKETTHGVVNGMFFSPPPKVFKVFCTDAFIVLLTPTFVEILELSNLKHVGLSAQLSITEDLLIHSKLSDKRNILALPVVSGDMGFFQLNFQESCLGSSDVEGFMSVSNFMLKRLLECNKC